MKTGRRMMTALGMLAGILWAAGSVWAGDLIPPGAPGPTMRTLTEIHDRAEEAEPRTAITGGTLIAESGSYYLADNITDTIYIWADNVTLDLMGFRIAPESGGPAIYIDFFYGKNTLIRNGTLRPGSGSVALDARHSHFSRFENLRIEGGMTASHGIWAGQRSLVRDCDVRDCIDYGIYVGNNTEVRDNRVTGGTQTGIRVGENCRIEGNRVEDHGGTGIHVTGAGTVLANNTVRNNNPDFDLHAQTVQVPSPEELQQQIAGLQQQLDALQQRQGVFGMAKTVGGMVLIPAGPFRMGDAFDEGEADERPVHTVTVSAFYMDQYPVTKALWNEVRAWANDAELGYTDLPEGVGKGPSHPVHSVNWYDAVKWANARSEREGLEPAYFRPIPRPGQLPLLEVYREGEYDNIGFFGAATGYRLPTEAEWEKAARGGVEGRRFAWADGNTIAHTRANYMANPSTRDYDVSATSGSHPDYDDGVSPRTSPVGSFAPNGYGLYDMTGNVWEWCWDWYGSAYYGSSPDTDPRGPTSGVVNRVMRGGSCSEGPVSCRSANRFSLLPSLPNNRVGFRLVRAAQGEE